MALVLLVILLTLGLMWVSWAKRNDGDIIECILKKTAPVAAADELVASNAMTCLRKLNGAKLLITKGRAIPAFAYAIHPSIFHMFESLALLSWTRP